eukprot:CAMPEP_0175194584 /NCGR_PEP_ID=MMETSP0093-20121207/6567_1 /TAXON_ID=311494 /ORGANISM="Alexandrium monilatum, Strain CCMP3105" /LENGTH=740 /DNA_ID=CAMNT_0016487511 /DNA_START=38 /DNA_END=2260 /DNA_ORIENTATION=+
MPPGSIGAASLACIVTLLWQQQQPLPPTSPHALEQNDDVLSKNTTGFPMSMTKQGEQEHFEKQELQQVPQQLPQQQPPPPPQQQQRRRQQQRGRQEPLHHQRHWQSAEQQLLNAWEEGQGQPVDQGPVRELQSTWVAQRFSTEESDTDAPTLHSAEHAVDTGFEAVAEQQLEDGLQEAWLLRRNSSHLDPEPEQTQLVNAALAAVVCEQLIWLMVFLAGVCCCSQGQSLSRRCLSASSLRSLPSTPADSPPPSPASVGALPPSLVFEGEEADVTKAELPAAAATAALEEVLAKTAKDEASVLDELVKNSRGGVEERFTKPEPEVERLDSGVGLARSDSKLSVASGTSRAPAVPSFVASAVHAVEPPLVILGCGTGGIDEMRALIDDSDASVQWGYLKFALGQGTFRRQKLLFLHVNGKSCPSLARGMANQHTSWVQNCLCGSGQGSLGPKGSSAKLEVRSKEEVTKDALLSRVDFLVSDDLGEHSVQWTLRDYEEQIQEASRRVALDEKPGRRVPGHQSSLLFSKGRDALKAVGSAEGPWNWVLMRPDAEALPLVAGGGGSLEEMQESLRDHQQEVLAGLLRMTFGEGRLRRSKHVLVFSVGSAAPPVARGKLSLVRAKVEKAISEFVHISCVLELASAEDLTLEAVIDKVRKAAHIDDEVLDGDTARRQLWTLDAFRQAQREERCRAAASSRLARFAALPVREAIDLLHADESLNWALFGLKAASPRLQASPRGQGRSQ